MNNKSKFTTRDTVYIALFAVLMTVCSYISIPMTIPFTMQTFAVYFALNFLGPKKGTLSICVYLLLGILGIPVFSSGTAGIGVVIGVTGGYMIGWLFSGLSMWITEKILGNKLWAQAVSMLIGLLVCYIAGTAWFMVVYARTSGAVGLWTVLTWCVFPFIIPDIAKLGLALWLSRRLKKVTKIM